MDVHQTICAVDIAGFGGMQRTRTNYVEIRDGMFQSVRQAFEESDIPWAECYREGGGDSILLLAPAPVSKGRFAGTLPRALDNALRTYNERHPAEEQIKLRLALHAGEITYDAHGVAAPAIIHTFRLLDAKPLKTALAGSPGTLAVIASNWFFDEVIRHRPEHEPDAYRRVTVEVKETTDVGWIRLLGHDLPANFLEPAAKGTVVVTAALRPASPTFYQVVAALEAIPCMQSEHSRSLVTDQLSFSGSITYFPSRRAHLISVLRSCLDYENGVVELVTAISHIEQDGSIGLKRLLALLTGGSI